MASKKLQDLQYEFDGLLKGVKRKEQLKGSKSKFYPVFKARGMKPLKTGGPVVKTKFGTSGLLAGMAGMGSGAKAMAKKPKRKIIKKKKVNKENSLKKKAGGGLVGGQKKLDVNRDGKITGSDFKMLKMNKKKYGGKINYRMKGGQVVDAGYD